LILLASFGALMTPDNSSLPNIKSMKGMSILNENKLKMIEREIKKV
jgi:hypothetical protein